MTLGPLLSRVVYICVPVSFNRLWSSLHQKQNLDPNVPSNFMPISKLPFHSKVLEKVLQYINNCNSILI